jgi:hypothetical protein
MKPQMKVLYLKALSPEATLKVDEVIESLVSEEFLEVYRDIESFKERLKQPTDSVSVLLLAVDKDVLKKLLVLQNHLHKLRLVVILPDKDQETVALGSKLQPRFLSYTFGNFSVVKTVLKKIFSNRTPEVPPPTHPPKAASRNTNTSGKKNFINC